MRKVELLPTQDCEAGYAPGFSKQQKYIIKCGKRSKLKSWLVPLIASRGQWKIIVSRPQSKFLVKTPGFL